MQFTENSVLGLRAAVLRLTHPSHPTEFVLCPMIHIGEVAYFAAVRVRLGDCDTLLYEGVRTFSSRLLTQSYRLAVRRRRLRLVTQASVLRWEDLPGRRIHADVTGEEFTDQWRRVPWHTRVALAVLAPLYGAWMFLTASRSKIARRAGVEDLESRRDLLRGVDMPEYDHAMFGARDAKLVAAVDAIVAGEPVARRAAVVFGASHMRVVSRRLLEHHGYRIASSDWLTVMAYDDG
jgi:hypothetical protein